MMRLSRNLRRFRWFVFAGWLLALVPAIYLAMTQSGNLTGGGFEVAGSQSLAVHDQLVAQYPELGASPLALVAAPRADATYQDINDAVAELKRIAGELPGVTEAPNPTQRPPQPDRPYVVTLRLDARNPGTSDVAKKLRERVGIKADQSGQTANGHVRLYVIGQGALSAAAAANTKHDIAKAYDVESEGGVAFRGAFLIDDKGVVRSQIINDLPLGRNMEELIRLVDALQFHEEHGEVCPANWKKGDKGMNASPEGVAAYLTENAGKL